MADAVVADFERNGIRCWYAPRDIIPGTEWVAAIKEGIHAAKVFVLLFTDESNTSRQVMNEVAMAFNAEKTIVPFKLTKQEMSDELEYYLTRVHWLDAVSEPLNSHIEELRKYVQLILSGTERETVPAKPTQKSRKMWPVVLITAAAVLAIAAVLLVILKPFGSENGKTGNETVTNTPVPNESIVFFERGEASYRAGDYDSALACYLKAVEAGYTGTDAYYRIGTICLEGKAKSGVNEEKALSYLELAYNDGAGEKLTADEYYFLAYKYDSDATAKNPEKVCRYALKGAEAGSVPCMLLLGEAYWYGNGVEQDYDQVLNWFGKALDSGVEGYNRNYCINCITTLVEEGHIAREAASKWIGEDGTEDPAR